ncbi:MAG: fibronectin type III domain-containing protein [Candidatus Gastranaerophilaceae bacterium]
MKKLLTVFTVFTIIFASLSFANVDAKTTRLKTPSITKVQASYNQVSIKIKNKNSTKITKGFTIQTRLYEAYSNKRGGYWTKWEKAASVSGKTKKYTITGLSSSTKYQIRVKANATKKSKKANSKYSKVKSVKTIAAPQGKKLATPTLKVTFGVEKVTFKISNVTGAEKYLVQCNGNSKWIDCTTLNNTEGTITPVDGTWEFRVKAIAPKNSGMQDSDWSNVVKGYVKPIVPYGYCEVCKLPKGIGKGYCFGDWMIDRKCPGCGKTVKSHTCHKNCSNPNHSNWKYT